MAQHDYDIANQSFPAFRTDLNNVLEAINTSNSGTSRPSGAVAGTIWLDTSGGVTAYILKFYDGADDIALGTINTTANTVDWTDSSVIFDIVNDTSPQLGGQLDVNGNAIGDGTLELLKFVETASAVNELTITNNSAGNNPILSATGDDTNIGINLTPKGTGEIIIDAGNLNYGGTAVTSTGAELNKLAGAGTLKQAGKETIWIPAVAMYPSSTGGAPDPETIEITADANRPVIKAIAFDKDTDEYAQFSVAFPKSWDEGTITFKPFFTANTTNTGTALFMLKGITVSDNDVISQDFGTAQGTAKAHSGTAYDLNVGDESSAITIAGSPTVGDQTFFAIFRDVSGDTLTADALLTGIKIFYTTDAANDA
jgi:hypothetical protein